MSKMGVDLCNVYQDMIGIHGRGIRSYRIGSMVIIDIVITMLFSAAIYQIPWVQSRFNFRILTAVLILLITFMHRSLCANVPDKD
jgi:hypothetical protein